MIQEFLKWAFGGIGGDLLFFILGSLVGGFTGYRIKSHQVNKQKAGDHATQIIGENNNNR